jgi:hypothetical protein
MTLSQQARQILIEGGQIPASFEEVQMPHLGGEMEYVSRFADGSYLSVTPSSDGTLDYFCMNSNCFDQP